MVVRQQLSVRCGSSTPTRRAGHERHRTPRSGRAGPRGGQRAQDDFDQPPADLEAGSLASFAEALGAAIGQARSSDQELFGYAEQSLTTSYLASTTGLRARYVQPAARAEVNGKAAGRTRSAW